MTVSLKRREIGKTTSGANEDEHYRLNRSNLDNKLSIDIQTCADTNGIDEGAATWLLFITIFDEASSCRL